jgi:alpha-tubulin suppressor-like RCC1 family protein
MKAFIWRFSLLLAVLALTGMNPNSAAAVSSPSPGVAWAWGKNLHGQLGNSSTSDTTVPVAVQMPENVTFTTISTGPENSLALDTAGQAWAWGENDVGQLGNNSTDQSPVPVAVQMPANVAFATISTGFGDYSLALDTAGHAWAWGGNQFGQLGNNSVEQSLVPVAVQMPPNVTFTAISAGYDHSLALDTVGDAWAWGSNAYGQLGGKSTNRALVPVAVQMPDNVAFTTISAGRSYNLALDTAGQAWAWGNNGQGQLGNNGSDQSLVPVAVQMPANVAFISISAGDGHSLALDALGDAWAWGGNTNGQLGNTSMDQSRAPVAVQMPTNVMFTAISAGYTYSLALDTTGQAWGWGYGPLGNNNSTGFSERAQLPVAVQMPASVTFTMISARMYHALALQPVSDQR